MKLLLVPLLALFISAGSAPQHYPDLPGSPMPWRTPSVYVCDSKTSVAYHANRDCRGLQKCTHNIVHVTLSDAVNVYKKRACKICY